MYYRLSKRFQVVLQSKQGVLGRILVSGRGSNDVFNPEQEFPGCVLAPERGGFWTCFA